MNTETIQTLLARVKVTGWGDSDTSEAYEALTSDEKHEFTRLQKLDYFVPANAQLGCRREHVSESGKYKLVTTPFSTKEGGWNYTQGLVYTVGNDQPIAEVQRNYSSFPFEFVEDHPNGHAYLVCGEDYQGQTVVELDTGKRRDFLPPEAEKGHGFCWADYKFDKATQILLVDGCYWACPYMFRFYDFSNPMEGWPEIESEEWIDADAKAPTFEPDGAIKTYQTREDEDSDEVVPVEKRELASVLTFRREGLKLVKIDEWVSEAEKERRLSREEAQRKYEAWEANFKATDPLYLAHLELLKDPVWKPADYAGRGITYDGWCPDFKGKETRWCRQIMNEGPCKIEVEWAAETGPIKLEIYRDSKKLDDQFFPHSVEGMHAAFATAKEVLLG